MSARLAAHIRARPDLDPADVASASAARARLDRRAVVVGEGREALLAGLDDLAVGTEAEEVVVGSAPTAQAPVFLFPGQGSQHVRMAFDLYRSSRFFKEQMDACEVALSSYVDWSLQEVLSEESDEWLGRLDVVQPALFAVMVSLGRLWQACGVDPVAVLGHSQGEIAAAHIAGILSLEDAALIVARRAQAMAMIAGQGGMLSVAIPEPELRRRLDAFDGRLSLAAVNGPTSLVVSGERQALEELESACGRDGIRCRPIAVDYAAHSVQVDALKDDLLEAFATITPHQGEVPMRSTVTGEPIDGHELGPEYWVRNLRQTVRFESALRAELEDGRRAFIEIGPHPVLALGAAETAAQSEVEDVAFLQTLRRNDDGARRFTMALAAAAAAGVEVDWRAVLGRTDSARVLLPTYPFQRERYWLESVDAASDPSSLGLDSTGHPLLGSVVSLAAAGGGFLFTGRLSLAAPSVAARPRGHGHHALPCHGIPGAGACRRPARRRPRHRGADLPRSADPRRARRRGADPDLRR